MAYSACTCCWDWAALVLLMIVTAGAEPLRSYMSIAKVALVFLFLAVLASSTLKWFREHPPTTATEHAATK